MNNLIDNSDSDFNDCIYPLKKIFSSNSSNDELHKDKWIQSAATLIPRMNQLLEKTVGYKFNKAQIRDFYHDNCDDLGCDLFDHDTHKVRDSSFYILYNYVIEQQGGKKAKIKILEIGTGSSANMFLGTDPHANKGAALKGFKTYLPNALLYGCDIDRQCLVNEKRIRSVYMDQYDPSTFGTAIKELGESKFHLIIDDGAHSLGANINTLLLAVDCLELNGWYCIENITRPENFLMIDYILTSSNKFRTYMISCEGGYTNDCQDSLYAIQRIRL